MAITEKMMLRRGKDVVCDDKRGDNIPSRGYCKHKNCQVERCRAYGDTKEVNKVWAESCRKQQ